MKPSRSSLGFASLGLLALAGCPVTADDLCAKAACESAIDTTSPSDAGTDADAIVEAPTDPCVDKPTAPECVSNDSALFVSASADATIADGTIQHPFKTITAAVNEVTNTKRRIYVCEGIYPEQVSLETVPMTLIGGLSCNFGGPGAKPKIAPPSGIALAVAAVGGTSVIDVAVEGSSDPNKPGDSAIAMFVTRAKNILLRGVEATANEGRPGATGTPFAENYTGIPVGPNSTSSAAGAAPPDCGKCKDGTTYSYAGGGGTAQGGYPEAGAAQPPVGTPNPGSNGTSCTGGKDGALGEPAPAAEGASRPGVLQASAWNTDPTSKAGGLGNPGQGGGGGGASTTIGGGSGGCGGCGGGGGGGGGNGGSSFALLVYQSELVIEASTFTASNAGQGGEGAPGQGGQQGVTGGAGICNGGTGAYGAGGGGGGGGAGGHSAAIAYVGVTPTVDERTTLFKGTGGGIGKGGEGGTSTTGKPGNRGRDGAEGKTGEILDID